VETADAAKVGKVVTLVDDRHAVIVGKGHSVGG
jgi:hypothetical protein